MNNNEKSAAIAQIASINAVDGFDPTLLAVDYTDMNTGETRKRLPVMAQVAWFRLKYPEGRYAISVTPGKDCFVATARVYKHYMDPVECYLSEASASRGYLRDKPTVSPREWAQTAALGIALRNAGFGLQFHAAGENFDESAVYELGQETEAASEANHGTQAFSSPAAAIAPLESNNSAQPEATLPAEDPLEAAKKIPCPTKYPDKTLGDLVTLDPSYLIWIATKYTKNLSVAEAAKRICEYSVVASA